MSIIKMYSIGTKRYLASIYKKIMNACILAKRILSRQPFS